MRLRLGERDRVRAFWRSHFEVWAVSGLTQRDYCERHGLAKRRTIRLKDMAAQPLLCVGEHINPGFYRSVLAAFVAVGITPPIVQQANSLVVLSLVETGMVIGIVSSALRWRITPHLLMRRVEEFLPSTSVDLVWRRNDKSGVLGSFVDCATAGLMERGKVTAAESRDQEACRPDLAWTFANSSAILKATGRWHEEQGNAEP